MSVVGMIAATALTGTGEAPLSAKESFEYADNSAKCPPALMPQTPMRRGSMLHASAFS